MVALTLPKPNFSKVGMPALGFFFPDALHFLRCVRHLVASKASVTTFSHSILFWYYDSLSSLLFLL
jgi:hypothetical protein